MLQSLVHHLIQTLIWTVERTQVDDYSQVPDQEAKEEVLHRRVTLPWIVGIIVITEVKDVAKDEVEITDEVEVKDGFRDDFKDAVQYNVKVKAKAEAKAKNKAKNGLKFRLKTKVKVEMQKLVTVELVEA